jgi:hypothetical protein
VSGFGTLAENVDEVSTDDAEGELLMMREVSVAVGVRILVDGDYGFVFAQDEPIPHAFPRGAVVLHVCCWVLGIFAVRDVVEGVVAQTDI